ncbi:hypothetical protein Tco_1003999 [Tanacetum coccineum]|uniref:Uncharacterized protein n=1 Tax=Tanacetum coccineum TaxID=301880 RepID=A0ABQ5FAN3_9ASTR
MIFRVMIAALLARVDAGRDDRVRDVGYGIRDTWVDPAEVVPEIAPMTLGEVNTRVSLFHKRVDMNSQRVDLLMGDRMTLQETVWMVEEEAYASARLGLVRWIRAGDYQVLQTQASGTDGRDSPSHQRYEARDERTCWLSCLRCESSGGQLECQGPRG